MRPQTCAVHVCHLCVRQRIAGKLLELLPGTYYIFRNDKFSGAIHRWIFPQFIYLLWPQILNWLKYIYVYGMKWRMWFSHRQTQSHIVACACFEYSGTVHTSTLIHSHKFHINMHTLYTGTPKYFLSFTMYTYLYVANAYTCTVVHRKSAYPF